MSLYPVSPKHIQLFLVIDILITYDSFGLLNDRNCNAALTPTAAPVIQAAADEG